MYSFLNDYNEIAHPAVMQTLNDLSGKRFKGYGTDEVCSRVAAQIRLRIGQPSADVHFFNGGTITNLTTISQYITTSPSGDHRGEWTYRSPRNGGN